MKLAKFALTSPLVAISVALCAALSSFGDVVYVKPVACGSGDGSSWANAMGSVKDALLQSLRTAAPHEVRMAKGMHEWSEAVGIGRDYSSYPGVSGSYTFTIRGGYAGEAEDETPDNEANPTYLNCDTGHNDRWLKRNLADRFYNNKDTTEDLGKVIDDNGEVVLPPEVTADEIVYPDPGSNRLNDNSQLFDLKDNNANNCVVTLEGFTVVGGGVAKPFIRSDGKSDTAALLAGGAANIVLKSMTFLGCYFPGSGGIIEGIIGPKGSASAGKAELFSDVKILNSYVNTRIISFGYGYEYGTVEGLTIRDAYFYGTVDTGAALYLRRGFHMDFTDCVFEKCYANGKMGNFGPSTILGMEEGADMLFDGCVFRNNWAKGANMTSAMNLRSTSNGAAQRIRVVDTLFEGNKTYVTTSDSALINLGVVAMAKNDDALIGCTFRDNVLTVKPTGTCGKACAAPLTITSQHNAAVTTDPRRTVVNCTFGGNTVEVADGSNEATPVFARSILVNSLFAGNPLDIVLANNTFVGTASDLPDVRWFGLDKTHPVQILNSYFYGDAASGYVPFASDDAAMVTVDNSLMNGLTALPTGVTGADNVFMELPLSDWDDLDGTRDAAVIRPVASVPDLRTAQTLSYFVDTATATVGAFYPLDKNGNHLYKTVTATGTAVELPDAVGDSRPLAAATIGAVQKLGGGAEDGATLFLTVTPKGAGTLSGGESIQVVEKGAGIVPVTATSSDPARYTFEGWKLPDGTLYSDSATLAISSLDDNLQLTAAFSAPKVTYTFKLGIAGTFDATGASTAVLELNPGEKLTVPAFTIDEEKVVPYGWDVTPPETVGMTDQTFTYQYLEKIYRIIRVDTHVAEAGDGSSWSKAMADIQSAITLASAWKGEVWVRQGVHLFATKALDSIQMKNNVKIMGGFEGVDGKYGDTDAERAARDCESFRTVLTGDLTMDDTWKCNGADLKDESGAVLKVVADGRMQFPEFQSGKYYYGHRANGGNANCIFNNSDEVLDDTAVLDGVTLTGAGYGVLNGASAVPLITNCTFVGSPKCIAKALIHCEDCLFLANDSGNLDSLETTVMRCYGGNADGVFSVIRNCTFRYCYGQDRGIFVFSDGTGYFKMTGCRFEQCTGSSGVTKYRGTLIGAEWGKGEFRDLTVKGCWNTSGTWLMAVPSTSAVVSNCLFEANSIVHNGAGADVDTGNTPSTILGETNDNGSFKVIGCTFRDNVVSRMVGNHANSKNGQVAVVYLKGTGGSTLVNCTFANNTVTCASNKPEVVPQPAVALVRDWMNGANLYCAKASVVNCTFANNVAADGDVCLAERLATTPFYLVNTICWGGEGHKAVTANGAGNAELYAWNSIVHGLDTSAGFVAEAVNCATTSPGAMRKWVGEAPVLGKMPGSNSAARNGGRNVYVDANGVICAPTDAGETAFVNLATGAAVTPADEKTMLADVFGEARPAGRVTVGAVQSCKPDGLMLMIR